MFILHPWKRRHVYVLFFISLLLLLISRTCDKLRVLHWSNTRPLFFFLCFILAHFLLHYPWDKPHYGYLYFIWTIRIGTSMSEFKEKNNDSRKSRRDPLCCPSNNYTMLHANNQFIWESQTKLKTQRTEYRFFFSCMRILSWEVSELLIYIKKSFK